MAFRKYRKWIGADKYTRKHKRNMRYASSPKVVMGRMFTTRKGKYGCYKYVNGTRVAFVTKRRSRR